MGLRTEAHIDNKVYQVEYVCDLDAGPLVICKKCGERNHTRDIDIRSITTNNGYVAVDMEDPTKQELIADIGKALGHGEPNCSCWMPEPKVVPRKKK